MSNPAERDQSKFSIKRVEYNIQMLLQHNISTVYNGSLGKNLNSSSLFFRDHTEIFIKIKAKEKLTIFVKKVLHAIA